MSATMSMTMPVATPPSTSSYSRAYHHLYGYLLHIPTIPDCRSDAPEASPPFWHHKVNKIPIITNFPTTYISFHSHLFIFFEKYALKHCPCNSLIFRLREPRRDDSEVTFHKNASNTQMPLTRTHLKMET